MDNPAQFLEEILKVKLNLRNMYFEYFAEHEFLSWQWWVMIGLLLIPLIVWWIVVDKKRLLEICVFGLLVNILATFLDVAGSDYMLWEYVIHTLPRIPLLIPVDFVVVPVVGMLLYQKFRKWGMFLLASAVASMVMTFVFEPIAVAAGIYKLISWKYIYSFPIYIVMFMGVKLLTQILVAANKRAL